MKGDIDLVNTSKELVATKICGPNQERIQITKGSSISIPRGCQVKLEDHQIYGEESLRHQATESQIFDWKWDTKRI